ncbi:MAG: 2,3-bisphosphoglycerate-independent phosphoglycerate mutase, partial [Planctomycetes bacterium]|nr:2,3-bisphosphoglycerate-independent phosphoglycerate mutase [Planctomycetota bacterium]
HTAHTTNPVPMILASEALVGRTMKSGGRLCDIAPTLLPLMGLSKHPSMDGISLL